MSLKAEWETVIGGGESGADWLERVPAPGGWIYKATHTNCSCGSEHEDHCDQINASIALAFVPLSEGPSNGNG